MVLSTLSKEKILEEILSIDNWITTCFMYTLNKLLPEESKLKKFVRKIIIAYLGFIRFIMKNKLEHLINVPNVLMSEIMDQLNLVTEMSIKRGINTLKYNVDKIPTCFISHKDKFNDIFNDFKNLVEPINWTNKSYVDIAFSIPKDIIKYSHSLMSLRTDTNLENAFMQNVFKEHINSLKQAKSGLSLRDNIECGTLQREVINNMLYTTEYLCREIPEIIKHNQENFVHRCKDVPIQYFSYLSALIVILVAVFIIISMFTCLWKGIRFRRPSPLKLTYYGYGRKSRSRSVYR